MKTNLIEQNQSRYQYQYFQIQYLMRISQGIEHQRIQQNQSDELDFSFANHIKQDKEVPLIKVGGVLNKVVFCLLLAVIALMTVTVRRLSEKIDNQAALNQLKQLEIQSLNQSLKIIQKQTEKQLKLIMQLAEMKTPITSQSIQLTKQTSPVQQTLTTQQTPPAQQTASVQPPINYQFQVPNFIWYYQMKPYDKLNYIQQRSYENIKWYSKISYCELRIVSANNYEKWLSPQHKTKVQQVLSDLQSIRDNYTEVDTKFQNIAQTVIQLYLLKQHGGVFIKSPYIFTQNLQWIKDVKNIITANTGNPYAKPEIFAFHHSKYGSQSQRQFIKRQIKAQKHMIKYPGLLDYFIAALPNSSFITQVLPIYTKLVLAPNKIKQVVSSYHIVLGDLKMNNLDQTFSLASLIALTIKQKQLDKSNQKYEQIYSKYAIDQYGIFSINNYYYPDKLLFYFNNKIGHHDNFYTYVVKISQQQFQDSIGPLRYIINPDPNKQFNWRIESARDNKGYSIYQGTFFHKHLFMDKQYSFINKNKQFRSTAVSSSKWESLQKILWVFAQNGFDQASAINQLCMLNLQKNAQKAGFKVNIVSESNLHEFIDQKQLNAINTASNTSQIDQKSQIRSDLLKLFLIYTYGGIYLDSSYFFLQDFNWIINVAQQPAYYFYNRFGSTPKVLMQFNPVEGGSFDWNVDQKHNTKVQWHLGYQGNFIAAEKGNQLIKDWYDLFKIFINSSYEQTQNKMRECDILYYKWTDALDRSLSIMDSIKSVLGCKQNDINANKTKYGDVVHANDYYKLWAFSGFTGIQKFRQYNNYANSYKSSWEADNVLLYRVSQKEAEAVYGKIFKAVKFYGSNIIALNSYLQKQRSNNFVLEAHPESVLMKYLLNVKEQQLYQTDKLHARNKA